jgi:apolipoprotein N-acyltransferase
MRVGISPRDAAWSLTAGIAGAAAFPPLGIWPLVLVSVVLFLFTLGRKPAGEARVIGLVYGLVFGLGTMYWFFGIFSIYAVTLVALMAGYFGLMATLIGMTSRQNILARALLTGCFAVAIEWLRGDAWYLRFPWYTAPHALAQSPAWIAACRWLGSYGLTFIVWTIAACAAFGKLRYALTFCLLPGFALLLPPIESPDRTALLVQIEESHRISSMLDSLPYQRVDLVVLPEYAYPDGIQRAIADSKGPVALARRFACPVIFGTVEGSYGERGFQNVAAVLDGDGQLVGTFPKQRPVPLMVDGLPGDRCPVFPLSVATLGIGLCYDFDAPAIAGSLSNSGATVLLAPTGDLMSWGGVQHVNHELLVRLRAVENDRWILRATTSGQSEAVDPHGYPSTECLGIDEVGTVTVRFGNRERRALGSKADWLGPVAAGLTLLWLAASLLGRKKGTAGRNEKRAEPSAAPDRGGRVV